MNKKLLLTLFVLVAAILSINAVCANDMTTDLNTEPATDDTPLELSAADENTLSEQSEDTTFTGLNTTINSEENIIEITTDYSFNNETDQDFAKGIFIERDNLVINGNNHIIDAKHQGGIFQIYGKNITINNLIFKNGGYGAIILANRDVLETNNVEFIESTVGDYGAVYVHESNYISVNDKFINNSASTYGAAIYATLSNVTIRNGLFESNNALNWSSVYCSNSNLYIENTTFANSSSKYATAIYNTIGITSIKKSKFLNLFANITAGAIGFKDSNNVEIVDCEFINVSSAKNGGAIYADIGGARGTGYGNALINNTLFENCSSEFGGAYLQLCGELMLINSDFINNYAKFNGGAVYLSKTEASIENCTFQDNYVNTSDERYPTYGGAAFIDISNASIADCEFTNNKAMDGSALYIYDSKYHIDNVELNGNSNAIYTVFDHKDSEIGEITGSDEVSPEDLNNTYYPNMVDGAGMQIILLNNTVNITNLPARYDLREKNLVTPVRNQGDMGACWAFGSIAALETALLKAMNYTADFSENNMQDLMITYSIYGCSAPEGGDGRLSSGYLLSWLGAFPKSYDPYDELGKISPAIITSEDLHVQDIVIIPNTPGDADSITSIKQAIIKYGGLAAILLTKSTSDEGEPTGYYNENTSAQYIPFYDRGSHEVCVVGWDDNFSKDKFTITPPGDGAWICKNSWGTKWGDEGFFYVSYYDQTLCANSTYVETSFIAFPIENTVPYTKNYQYDFPGIVGQFYEDGTQITYRNNFESYGDDLIAAVGTYFNEEGVEYTVEIEVNGDSVYTQTGVSPYYGYHTIKLDKYIPIKEGDLFSATITSNAMPLCNDTRVHIKEGSSLMYSNGIWQDLGKNNSTACLKVYTVEDDRHNTTLDTQDKSIYVTDAANGYDYQFVLKDENGTALSNKEVQVSFKGETQIVTTDEKGQATATLKANAEGNWNVEMTFEGDDDYREISQNATITLKRQKTSIDAQSKQTDSQEMSNGYAYTATLKDNSGKPIADKEIQFIFGGERQTARTDKNGRATVTLKTAKTGPQTITIKFSGDNAYEETTATKTITIKSEDNPNPETPQKAVQTISYAPKTAMTTDSAQKFYEPTYKEKVVLTIITKEIKVDAKNKKIVVTLKTMAGKPIAGVKITITINGKTYTAITDENGTATFVIDITQPGNYTITAQFNGTEQYAATNVTAKIDIH